MAAPAPWRPHVHDPAFGCDAHLKTAWARYIFVVVESTAGLILAAGLGTRFGGRKLLAPIDGKPMLQHVLDLAAAADLSRVVIVLGREAEVIEANCRWRDELRVRNYTPEQGLASSVKTGLWTLLRLNAIQRVVVLLGDEPFLTVDQLRVVLAAAGQIVVPRFDGRPGNPVVLDRSTWQLAARIEGDRGFSQVFSAYPNLVTYVDVPGTNRDIDTPGDLASWTNSRRESTKSTT
jgi:molybdenum cofactor cytidylyltransferase